MEPEYNFNIEVYKPNIHGLGNSNTETILFSIGRRLARQASVEELRRIKETFDQVNEIIKADVGQLNVDKEDLDTFETGEPQKLGDKQVPLDELLGSKGFQRALIYNSIIGISIDSALGYGKLIRAFTHSGDAVRIYEDTATALRDAEDNTLADKIKEYSQKRSKKFGLIYTPFELFDVRFDKEKAMAVLEKQLDAIGQMPENWASFYVLKSLGQSDYFGFIDLGRIKHGMSAEKTGPISAIRKLLGRKETEEEADLVTRNKRHETKAKLVEVLAKHEGPCLSYEAHRIMAQIERLMDDAPGRIGPVADIVLNKNWHDKLFSLDP
jgi:hypothetical protein